MELLTISQLFAILGIILMILEVITPGFVMLPMGVGFLVAAALIPFVHDTGGQLLVLAVCLFVTFLFFSKIVRPKLQKNRFLSNAESLVGQTGVVEEDIDAKAGKGYIKIYGDSWRALTLDGSIVKSGEKVVVERLEGNKVFVRKS